MFNELTEAVLLLAVLLNTTVSNYCHVMMCISAYQITYGDALVWQPYRRNHKGSIPPEKTRKTCIVRMGLGHAAHISDYVHWFISIDNQIFTQ